MTTLPNMGLVLPTRGPSGNGLWDDTVDEDLGRIDDHDHTSGKGTRVPVAGLDIDDDVSFGTQFAAIGLQRIQFATTTALTANNLSLFTNLADNELYWRTTGGANVKLTSGAGLNVAAFAGGIGGDYTASSAALNFDAANARYTLRGTAGTPWARMASGEVRIHETGTADTVFVGLAAPAALGSSYTLTFPTALPGTQQLAQVSAAGLLSFSNTIPTPVAVQNTLDVTGATTVGGTLGVTGLITATAGVTAAANQHVTISGTGRYLHGTVEDGVNHFNAVSVSNSTISTAGGLGPEIIAGGGGVVGIGVIGIAHVRAGATITGVRMRYTQSAIALGWTVGLQSSVAGAVTIGSISGPGTQNTLFTTNLPIVTPSPGTGSASYWLVFTSTASFSTYSLFVFDIRLVYTQT